MRIAVRGTELYFDVEGVGLAADGSRMVERPPLVVLHGGPGGDHAVYKPGMGRLSHRAQVIYLDHRGQGRSGRGDPATYTLENNVEDLETLRRHLGLGPIICIGTSYGGMVAMAHAARYPEAVSRLILVVTAAHHGFIDRAKEIVAERGTPDQRRVFGWLIDGAIDSLERLADYYMTMGPLYSYRYNREEYAQVRDRTIGSPEALTEAFRPGGFLRSFDLRPELQKITAPTLILAGRHDFICPPEFSEEIHALIPGSTLKVFENASHSIRGDQPDLFFAEIEAFLDGRPR